MIRSDVNSLKISHLPDRKQKRTLTFDPHRMLQGLCPFDQVVLDRVEGEPEVDVDRRGRQHPHDEHVEIWRNRLPADVDFPVAHVLLSHGRFQVEPRVAPSDQFQVFSYRARRYHFHKLDPACRYTTTVNFSQYG